MQTVFTYSKLATNLGVPAKFVGTPFLINEDGVFESNLSSYFLARRNGDYIPGEVSGIALELQGVAATQCDIGYLKNRAYQLDVYRRWCKKKAIDPVQIDSNQLERFARDYERGKITDTSALSPDSVNQELRAVIDFLGYCVATGRRATLSLPFKKFSSARRPSAFATTTSRAMAGKAYLVMRRVNPRDFTDWHTREELENFFSGFDKSHYRLGAEIIFSTGLRLAELLSLRVDSFPSPDEWKASRKSRYIRVLGKFKKWRRVEVELDIVKKVFGFKKTQRGKNLKAYGKSSNLLLIGEYGPVSRRMFQRAIHSVAKLTGCAGLSSHLLRHHYAAYFLLTAWKRKKSNEDFRVDYGISVLSHELIRLQQNLGHASPITTTKYLMALGYLTGSNISDELRESLDHGD